MEKIENMSNSELKLKKKSLEFEFENKKNKIKTIYESLIVLEDDYNTYLSNYSNIFPKKKKLPEFKRLEFDKDPYPEIIKYKFTQKQLEELKQFETLSNIQIPIYQVERILTDREINAKKRIILSNFKLLSAGADYPDLSVALFGSLVIGKITVNQTIGRITRIFEGKPNPQAHFFFPWIYTSYFKNNHFILTNNIKMQFPTTKFTYENFPREEKAPAFDISMMPQMPALV
jgi:predicted helicase